MLTLDLQPAKIVEDVGFKRLVATLDPRYHLPSRRVIMRTLLPAKYDACAETLLSLLETVESCSLTTDFWTSKATESYITVTCHFVDNWELKSCVLSTYQVTGSHTAEKIASELKLVAEKWKIVGKITCVVTDNASNMTAALRLAQLKSVPCFAHTLNLIVQASINKDDILTDLRKKCRDIVSFFKRSTRASDALKCIQVESGRGNRKLVQECMTRWNSTFYMMERIVEEYKDIKLTLCSFDHEQLSVSIAEVKIIEEALELLKPFEEVTHELSSLFQK